MKSMLQYADARLKLQKETELVSQVQKNKDTETNIVVSPVLESNHSGTVDDQNRKRRRKRPKRRSSGHSSVKEKNSSIFIKSSKLNKSSFTFPKMVANRVAPSKDSVLSYSNEIKKTFRFPKATISEQFISSSPRLIISNHLYLSKGPKLGWDSKSGAYLNSNIKGPIFKWVPKHS